MKGYLKRIVGAEIGLGFRAARWMSCTDYETGSEFGLVDQRVDKLLEVLDRNNLHC